MDTAFEWVKENGIPTESSYPYTARDGTCKTFTSSLKITGFTDVPKNSPAQMKAALNVQPLSVAINASSLWFQFYRGGVMDWKCSDNLDHGVLAVGYGHDQKSGKDFWKVKNSWGKSWGMNGYFLLKRTDNNDSGMCGILSSASYPTE